MYYTRYHIVIPTKYRRKVLKKGMGEYLKRKVLQISKFHPEIEIIKVNTNIDHMHIMVTLTAMTMEDMIRNSRSSIIIILLNMFILVSFY